jgi:biotin-(acetyl-CoA carboxylase) ligase
VRLLTDTPASAGAFAPLEAAWERVADGELAPPLAEAWRLLGAGAAAWRARDTATAPGDDASGRALFVLDRAEGSQFEALRRALREGSRLPPALASLALTGNGFRGQRERSWKALRGNLHLCVLERLDQRAAPLQAALTALPAVATARAIERVSDERVRPGLKWVNDLLVGGRKVAGVLSATQVQGERVTHVLFGIGVNVAAAPTLPADARAAPPGCLAHADPSLEGALPALTRAILAELDAGLARIRAGAGADVVEDYRTRAVFVGRRVALWPVADDGAPPREPIARGRVTEMLDDLSLRVEGIEGPVRSGRMTLLDDDAAAGAEDG